MKRNSALAKGLIAWLADQDITITGSQLERWSQAGLLPANLDHTQEVAAHFRALSTTGTVGHGGLDACALALAQCGFGCPRLREVLARSIGYSDLEDLASKVNQLPEPGETWTADGFAQVEALAEAKMVAVDNAPLGVAAALESLGPVKMTDPTTGRTMNKDETTSSQWRNAISMMTADRAYDPSALAAFGFTDTREADLLFALTGGALAVAIPQAILSASLDDLVRGLSLVDQVLSSAGARISGSGTVERMKGVIGVAFAVIIRRLSGAPDLAVAAGLANAIRELSALGTAGDSLSVTPTTT